MTVSNRSKGNRLQDWCAKWLLANFPGCSVHNQKTFAKALKIGGKVMWVSTRNDILTCIDVLMVSPDQKPWFIQCTSHTGIGEKIKKLLTVPWNLDHVRVFVWQQKEPRLHLIRELMRGYPYHDSDYELVTIAEIRNGKWIDIKEK